jgi:hypothetical protein
MIGNPKIRKREETFCAQCHCQDTSDAQRNQAPTMIQDCATAKVTAVAAAAPIANRIFRPPGGVYIELIEPHTGRTKPKR